MTKPKHRQSTGEMISTVCFAGMSLWLASEALVWDGGWLGLIGLWASSLACGLAAFRFLLQQLVDKIRD